MTANCGPVSKAQGDYITKALETACRRVGVDNVLIDLKIESIENELPGAQPCATHNNSASPPSDSADDDTELEPAKFKVGDTANLKCGGPSMTVIGFSDRGVETCWFNDEKNIRGAHFPAEALVGVPF